MMKNDHGKLCYKIALSGGPCSGKTTTINEIKEKFSELFNPNEWQLFTVMEASNLLYSGGVSRSRLNSNQLYEWQKSMLKTILNLEDVYDKLALYEDKLNTLIICDRGALDPKVYTQADSWQDMLCALGLTESDILQRYDAVIRLNSAPKCAYNTSNNKFRRETYEDAIKVNQTYSTIWKNHHRLVNIEDDESIHEVNDGWKQKFEKIVSVIREIIESSKAL